MIILQCQPSGPGAVTRQPPSFRRERQRVVIKR
jgi:hypothetical protein